MEYKRFLTATEVFQLFGVDSHALDELVERGDVQALADLGTFKYRSEDFAKLIQNGKLSARTSAEMFEVDDDGELPFLKIKKDDGPTIEDVSFIELDEDALEGAAESNGPISLSNAPAPTDTWFVDDEHPISLSSATSGEFPVAPVEDGSTDSSEFELVIDESGEESAESDSNVRLVDDEGMISFEDSDVAPSGSDSDVRLEGPVSSPQSASIERPAKSGTDSDVRLSSNVSHSDSDVVMLSDAGMSTMDSGDFHDSEISLALPTAKKPDSDSDVRIAPNADSSDVIPSASVSPSHQTDSDIVLIGFPGVDVSPDAVEPSAANRAETDSDVTLVPNAEVPAEPTPIPGSDPFAAVLAAAPDSDLNLAGDVGSVKDEQSEEESAFDFQIVDEASSDEIAIQPEPVAELNDIHESNTEFELSLDDDNPSIDDDHSVTLHDADLAAFLSDEMSETVDTSGVVVDHVSDLLDKTILLESSSDALAAADSGITMDAALPSEDEESDSGITLETTDAADSGITLETAALEAADEEDVAEEDSGISLEAAKPDSGLSLAPAQTESDIAFANLQEDSGIRLEAMDAGSGINLDAVTGDSGIMLEPTDSGIRLESVGDSGISIMAEDSGISLEDDDLHATFIDGDAIDVEDQNSRTANLRIQDDGAGTKDSGFDLSLKESDNTIELDFDEDVESGTADTIVGKDKGKKPSGKKSLHLSEAFQLDEPIEVEDLDISEDLDAAGFESEEEFVAIDDEVLDVDDEHFSSGVVSIPDDVEDADEIEDAVVAKGKAAKAVAPAKPKRPKSNEPEWGLAAVGPIIASAIALLITTTVLWGGITTMWSGAEAPGPAATLISTLAGLSPW